MRSILDGINTPSAVKDLTADELKQLAEELRHEMILATSKNGGHLASSLGAVEIVLAAYRALDMERDKLLFDVGHQAYSHKLLTGRRSGFDLLRKTGGISGFTRREESKYDVHDAGHASDALPTAVGLALARDIDGLEQNIVTVVGDASIAGGLSYEALNYSGQQQFRRFVIVLNDNEMSISRSVGALATYLANIRSNRKYNSVRDTVEESLSRTGRFGDVLVRLGERAKDATKQFLVPGMLFEDFGFTYLGPIDGHDVKTMQETLSRALEMDRPVVIHALTKKGSGYEPAELSPESFHGVGPFEIASGKPKPSSSSKPSYTKVFSQTLSKLARENENIVAITAAMPSGTGLSSFAEEYPNRTFDVGIAEECAVTMSSGLAIAGKVPVVAVYSTFLQRAYDEISTNVCLQNLHVVFAVDRAGLVGEDGSTHHGSLDLAYLRTLPNMRIVAPSCGTELVAALNAAVRLDCPVAVRFPRGSICDSAVDWDCPPIPAEALKRWETTEGVAEVSFLAVGRVVSHAIEAARSLSEIGITARVYDMRWVKPIDEAAVRASLASRLVVTVEEGTITGGFGSGVLETISDLGMEGNVLRIGLPDTYVGHGSVGDLFSQVGLDSASIFRSVIEKLGQVEAGNA